MNAPEVSEAPVQNRSRLLLLGLLAVFVGPLLLSTLMFQFAEDLAPEGRSNHGVLLEPVVPWGDMVLQTAEGDFDWAGLGKKWTVVQVLRESCDLDCEANLFKSRQVKEMLGRDSDRLKRVVLFSPGIDAQRLMAEHPKAQWLSTQQWANEQAVMQIFQQASSAQVFLLDPVGNLMMRFDADITSKGMLKDLKRLLKYSKLG